MKTVMLVVVVVLRLMLAVLRFWMLVVHVAHVHDVGVHDLVLDVCCRIVAFLQEFAASPLLSCAFSVAMPGN
jgi:hypothetical protein